jgi:hypothetical protein
MIFVIDPVSPQRANLSLDRSLSGASKSKARADLQVTSLSTAGDLTKSAVCNFFVQVSLVPQASIIENVEGFKAQRQTYALSKLLSAGESHVPLSKSRTAQIRLDPMSSADGIRG